jgi:Domain of Unknown Function (DUF748)
VGGRDNRTMNRLARRGLIVLGVVLLLGAAALVALRVALRQLPAVVAQALGPRATVESIELGWTGVEVRGLVVRGAPGRWPAAQELRAERVTVRPALSGLWRGRWDLARVTVEGGYLALLRTREGRLVVLPSLLERERAGGSGQPEQGATRRLRIESIALRGVALDLFDASIVARGAAPHRLRLADLHGEVGPLDLPALDERVRVDLAAVVKGAQRDGRLELAGTLTPATREADLKLDAQGLDLVALQPYLLKSGEASIRAGTLDLRLHAKAAQQRLNAPGRLVLRGLELNSGGGLIGTFGGVPRQAVLAAISRDGKIELDFKLEGRVDDPKFSVNELFAARFAVGLAEKLGLTLGGVVEGVGGVIKGLFGK